MTQDAASRFMFEVIRPARLLILERNSASVGELRETLLRILQEVRRLPNDIAWPDDFEQTFSHSEAWSRVSAAWPELGGYDMETGEEITEHMPEEMGHAFDDLADIAGDFENALRLAPADASGACSLLRFTADIHWGEHVEALARHLLWHVSAPEGQRLGQ